MNPLWKIGAGVGIILAAAVAALFLFSDGDTAALEQIIEQGMEAAKRGEAETCVSFIWPQYDFESWDYDEITREIRSRLRAGHFPNARIDDLEVSTLGETGSAKFRVTGIPDYPPLRINLQFRQEGQKWWIAGVGVEARY